MTRIDVSSLIFILILYECTRQASLYKLLLKIQIDQRQEVEDGELYEVKEREWEFGESQRALKRPY